MSAARAAPPNNIGRRNIFTCRTCHAHIVTVDVDDGATPMAIGCHSTLGCKGTMASSMYRVFDQTMRADFEFYRPPFGQMLQPGEAKAVAEGGLLLRWAAGEKTGLQKMVEARQVLVAIEQIAERIFRSEDLDEIESLAKEIGAKAGTTARSFGVQQ